MSSDADDGVIIDHAPDQEHPAVLTNKNQPFLNSIVSYVWKVFENHGYVIVIGAVVAYYAYQRSVQYLESKVQSKKNGDQLNLSAEEQMNRLEAMRRAREKQQAVVDAAAAAEADKIREREEAARQEKIDDWERHKKGLGYRSKSSQPAAGSSKTLKIDNFNPLMGHGGSGGGFRSNRPRLAEVGEDEDNSPLFSRHLSVALHSRSGRILEISVQFLGFAFFSLLYFLLV